MPLPLILGGLAIAASVFGVKKGVDAKSDYDSAERINRRARRIFDDAQEELETARDDANASMENLGKIKFSIFEESIIPFVQEFKKIKNFDYDKEAVEGLKSLNANDRESFKGIENTALAMQEVVGGGLTSLGAGGLAGLAAYGGVGLLGTASTGTAIGSLSGAAATNATLAWLGGGSLATGGLGIVGGTAVLGGIVAGPVLAIGGMMMASKAEEAKENAYANQERATLAAEDMNLATVSTKGIQARFDELTNVLSQLNNLFSPYLNGLRKLNAEEPLRLEKLRQELANRIIAEIDELLILLENYELSKKGVINKIKNLFVENTALIKLQSQVRGLSNVLGDEVSRFLFDLEITDFISAKPSELNQLCLRLKSALNECLEKPIDKVEYSLLSIENQKGLHMMFNLANTLNNLLEVQVLSDSGELTDESLDEIEDSKLSLDGFKVNRCQMAE